MLHHLYKNCEILNVQNFLVSHMKISTNENFPLYSNSYSMGEFPQITK